MDFQKILSKLNEIEPAKAEVKQESAPKQKLTLSEDSQLRVLAGVSSILEEGRRISDRETILEKKLTAAEKEKKEEVVKSMKKDKEGFKDRYGKKGEEVMHATATKIAKKKAESVESDEDELSEAGLDMNLIKSAQKGAEGKPLAKKDAESDANVKKPYGYRGPDGSESDEEVSKAKAKKKNESFRTKFDSMVEAKKKDIKGKKAEEKMDEAKKPDEDGDGVPDWADKKPGKDDNADKSKDKKETKGLSAKQKKLPPGLQKAIAKKKGTSESVKTSKKVVAESVEQKYTFKQCLQFVKESGGQQQIDPIDTALWKWAQRVAESKVQEGASREAMAAFVYERMGGEFTLYDVLSETK